MVKKIMKSKVLAVLVFLSVFTVSYSSNAVAWDRGHGGGHGGGRSHYYYSGGHWHNRGWFWGSFATGLVIGAIVSTLPPRYETVYVRGGPYYYCDGIYYRRCPSGYVVVQAPAITPEAAPPYAVTQPQVYGGERITINVPNSGGGYTPVTLVKSKEGYIGPQGEYYQGHPTVEQLRVLYGK